MAALVETMFLKRFCLPVDSDINLYEKGHINIDSCLCSHYNHVSCILQGKRYLKKARILTYGFNKMGDSKGLYPGMHAEHDAIRKLLPLNRNKRLTNINLLVIRVSGKNKLQISKPCNNCINIMKTLPLKLGYKIQNIYYSDNIGNIVKTSLKILDNEEKHYSKYYKNNTNCNAL